MRAIIAVKPGRALVVVGRSSSPTQTAWHTTWFVTSPDTASVPRSTTAGGAALRPAQSQTELEPGMTFTIEPMINLGSLDRDLDDG